MGEYTAPLFTVVTITLLCSWTAALTLTPLLCVAFLKVKPRPGGATGEPEGALYRGYRAFLGRMLRHPWVSMAVVAAVFVGVMSLGRYGPALFFPAMKATTLIGELKLPAGAPLQRTRAVVKQLEGFIAAELQTAFSGLRATGYREADEVIPILLRTGAADRFDLGKIEAINVHSQRGGAGVPLKQVAEVTEDWGPGRVLRKDRMRTVSVSSQLHHGVLAAGVVAQLEPWLQEQQRRWGLSLKYELGGADQASAEANQSIADKLPISGFIILLLLLGQFNNLRKPLIILTTIPLTLIGVVLGLVLAHSYFGFVPLFYSLLFRVKHGQSDRVLAGRAVRRRAPSAIISPRQGARHEHRHRR